MANIKICNKCGELKLDQYDFYMYWDKREERYYYKSHCNKCATKFTAFQRSYDTKEEYDKKHPRQWIDENAKQWVEKRKQPKVHNPKYPKSYFYNLILSALFSYLYPDARNWPIQKLIAERTEYLYGEYGITRNELFAEISHNFFTRGYANKYNDGRGKPITYVLQYVDSALKHIIRSCHRGTFGVGVSRADALKKKGKLDEFDLNSFTRRDTPDRWYAAKQIFEFMKEYFGAEDLRVIMGDTLEEIRADNLRISVGVYKMRLWRKIAEFKRIVRKKFVL